MKKLSKAEQASLLEAIEATNQKYYEAFICKMEAAKFIACFKNGSNEFYSEYPAFAIDMGATIFSVNGISLSKNNPVCNQNYL